CAPCTRRRADIPCGQAHRCRCRARSCERLAPLKGYRSACTPSASCRSTTSRSMRLRLSRERRPPCLGLAISLEGSSSCGLDLSSFGPASPVLGRCVLRTLPRLLPRAIVGDGDAVSYVAGGPHRL